MSHRGKTTTAPAPRPGADSSPAASAPSPVDASRARRWFLFVAAVDGVWILLLMVLAATTMNPVTVNRRQIRESRFVVTARVVDPARGTLEVEKDWTSQGVPDTLELPELAQLELEPGASYLVPLESAEGDRLAVTQGPEPNKPLVYPVSEASTSQLRALLDEIFHGVPPEPTTK